MSEENGWNALHMASSRGNEKLVEFLVKYGTPIDSIDADGCNALHKAVCHGHMQVVKHLIE